MSGHNNRTLLIAFGANLGIAGAKFVAAAITGSSAMLTEGVHSVVDSTNQLLLIWGRRQARKPPDHFHPMGYGRELYFWSFVVAVLVFALGAGVSVYEGIIHIAYPEHAVSPVIGYTVLLIAFVLEGGSTWAAFVEFKEAKGTLGWWEAVRRSKDPPAFIVLLENGAAMAGLLLAVESKALLIGEAADPELIEGLRALTLTHREVTGVGEVLTLHSAPDQIMVMMSVDFDDSITAGQAESIVDQIECEAEKRWPEVRQIYIRPRRHAVDRTSLPHV